MPIKLEYVSGITASIYGSSKDNASCSSFRPVLVRLEATQRFQATREELLRGFKLRGFELEGRLISSKSGFRV